MFSFNKRILILCVLTFIVLPLWACLSPLPGKDESSQIPPPKQIVPTQLDRTPIVSTPMLTPPELLVPLEPTPAVSHAGSSVESDPFTFYLFVYKDESLGRQPVSPSLYSDLEGVGAYMFWRYDGADLAGPVEEYWGTIPNLNLLNTYSEIKTGQTGGRSGGVLIPENFFQPGGAKPGNRVEIVLQLKTPEDDHGASISFSLRETATGFEPEGISINAISVSQDAEQARQVLIDFFHYLSVEQYEQADALYGGSYTELMDFAPGIDPDDHALLWQRSCKVSGLQCFPVRSISYLERTDDILVFNLEFSNPDGTLFVRQPCCGGGDSDATIASGFAYRVQKIEDGKYLVLDLPVYVP